MSETEGHVQGLPGVPRDGGGTGGRVHDGVADERSRRRPAAESNNRQTLAVGKFEVTFAEWDACVAAGGCKHKAGDEGWGRGKRPVINVSWDDAKEFVTWLSSKAGRA
jgi:formylglycine-generating enzyme required for sulfatase activity